ncbi:hypothetical protein KCU99_g3, partial [Aureobasidium melanogenum]
LRTIRIEHLAGGQRRQEAYRTAILPMRTIFALGRASSRAISRVSIVVLLGALFQAETWAKWFSTSMSWPSVESQYSETVLRSLDSVINQMDEPGLSGLPSSPTSLEASTMIL